MGLSQTRKFIVRTVGLSICAPTSANTHTYSLASLLGVSVDQLLSLHMQGHVHAGSPNPIDVALIKVEALDSRGRLVSPANTKLAFKVTGTGRLIGVGNGDPNCLESDKQPGRSLFNGLAQLIVQSTKQAGVIRIVAEGGNLKPGALTVRAASATPRSFVR